MKVYIPAAVFLVVMLGNWELQQLSWTQEPDAKWTEEPAKAMVLPDVEWLGPIPPCSPETMCVNI